MYGKGKNGKTFPGGGVQSDKRFLLRTVWRLGYLSRRSPCAYTRTILIDKVTGTCPKLLKFLNVRNKHELDLGEEKREKPRSGKFSVSSFRNA